MTPIQYAWMIYAAGSVGCCIATWWMFLWAWRFVRYSAVVTTMVILFTPFAIDEQTMEMAPAVYTLVFDGFSLGIESIKPLLKLMTGIWLIGIILTSALVFLTRDSATGKVSNAAYPFSDNTSEGRQTSVRRRVNHPRNNNYSDDDVLNNEERQARGELLAGEVPIRAIRD